MKLYSAMLTTDGDIVKMDVIEYKGGFWLVPEWLVSPDKKYMRPLRAVSLATIEHSLIESGNPAHFVVSMPIDKSVFHGHPVEDLQTAYVIEENPEIVFPNPDVLN